MAGLDKDRQVLGFLLLLLLGLGAAVGLRGMPGAGAEGSPGTGPDCALLEDPAARGLMSGAF